MKLAAKIRAITNLENVEMKLQELIEKSDK